MRREKPEKAYNKKRSYSAADKAAAEPEKVTDAAVSENAAEEFERRRKLILEVMNEKAYVPMKIKELAMLLDIPKSQRSELQRVINSLLEEGKISISAKGKLGKPDIVGVGFVRINQNKSK